MRGIIGDIWGRSTAEAVLDDQGREDSCSRQAIAVEVVKQSPCLLSRGARGISRRLAVGGGEGR